MARRLKKVETMHTMRPDGSCACGTKKCRTCETLFGDVWLACHLARMPDPEDDDFGPVRRRPVETFERGERWVGLDGRTGGRVHRRPCAMPQKSLVRRPPG